MSEQNPYKLPPAEHEATYQAIAQYYLPRSEPREHPHAIVTAGQPGAGKSGLASAAKEELRANGGYVLVDADKLRVRHRDFEKLLHEDDRSAADKTHADAGAWSTRLLNDAAAGKRNLVIDQTSRDPEAVRRLADGLHQAGYTVELRVMAVNERISEQRIHTRYEQQKAVDGYGRFSNPVNHAAAYAAVPVTVAAVEDAKAVHKISVYDKDHGLIQARTLQGGAWSGAARSSAEAVQAERARPLTLQEHAELATGYDKLAKMLQVPERQASTAEVAGIEALRSKARNTLHAEVFKQLPAEEATKRHPELAGAYGVMAAIERQTASQSLNPEEQRVVLDRAKHNIAASLARGEAPSIEIRPSAEQTRKSGLDR